MLFRPPSRRWTAALWLATSRAWRQSVEVTAGNFQRAGCGPCGPVGKAARHHHQGQSAARQKGGHNGKGGCEGAHCGCGRWHQGRPACSDAEDAPASLSPKECRWAGGVGLLTTGGLFQVDLRRDCRRRFDDSRNCSFKGRDRGLRASHNAQ